jgi:hypothetical protein
MTPGIGHLPLADQITFYAALHLHNQSQMLGIMMMTTKRKRIIRRFGRMQILERPCPNY